MMKRKLVQIFAGVFATATASIAFAQTQEASPSAPAPESAPAANNEERFRSIAITINPLSLALGRIGANIEYLPAKHHGIMLNPYGWFTSVGAGDSETSYSTLGAELGYHFYTGNRGANGFFIGPSLLFQKASSTVKAPGLDDVSSDFTAYGAAVDLGGQHVWDFGLTIGAGVGLMYLKSSFDGATSSTVKFDGVLPRFLATAGYSF